MFVKFASPDIAWSVVETMNGVSFDVSDPSTYMLKAQIAKSDMKTEPTQWYPPAVQAAPFAGKGYKAPPAHKSGGGKGPRSFFGKSGAEAQPVGTVDTLAIVGEAQKNFAEDELHGYFSQIEGFVEFKPTNRGTFVKFESPECAQEALAQAQENGYEVEMARSSMGVKRPSAPAAGAKGGAHQAPYHAAPAPKRPRIVAANAGEIDTIAMLGQVSKGFSVEQIQEIVSDVPGFVAFKANHKMGGGFAKFESPDMAQAAIEEVLTSGIVASMARSSMGA